MIVEKSISHYIYFVLCFFFFFKQKTAYEIGTGDWSSDVCSSDLRRCTAFLSLDITRIPGSYTAIMELKAMIVHWKQFSAPS